MNEFIVWHEDLECFIDETQCIFKDGTLFKNDEMYIKQVSEDMTMFWETGKTDIEGKKIYADSSIVEFMVSSCEECKIVASFTFCNDFLRYAFKIISFNGKEMKDDNRDDLSNWYEIKWNDKKEMLYSNDVHYNFKITGTLQEEKHLFKAQQCH